MPISTFQSEITRAAMKAEANERLLTLSTPKPRNEGPFRTPEWEVSLLAKRTL